MNIAVFVSGGGTNLQALIDAEARGALGSGKLSLVMASNEGAGALKRAEKAGIATAILRRRDFVDNEAYATELVQLMQRHEIGLIVLAGFLTVLPDAFCRAYENRIINVHPSLIPAFCGDGFYGLHVHEAALKKGVKVSGATVHFVNQVVDGGAIIAQRAVAVMDDDTPEALQARIMKEAEWVILPEAVRDFCDDKLLLDGNVVKRKGASTA